ncbi:hypothetical protein [Streptomyces sp. T028]|uniref:hypothetical protein n=1 Tax=Streptomyces sp. T028 TaxID=3394379 RepID=UPI003A8A5D6B
MTTPVPGTDLSPLNDRISELINDAKAKLEELGSSFGSAWGATGSILDTPAVAMGADPNASSIAATSQSLYWSQQAGKLDVSAVTASADVLKLDESGVSFMGAKLYEFPWVSAIEKKFGTASASAKDLENLKAEISKIDEGLTRAGEKTEEISRSVGRVGNEVSDLHQAQEAYKRKKVGDASRWATRQWVDHRLKTAKSISDRIKNDPAVARAGQDVQQLAQRVKDLEEAIGK